MSKTARKLTDGERSLLDARLATLSSRTEKVRDAAGYLFFTLGIYPSAAVIRDAIGAGSLGDINTDLRGWWEEVRQRGAVTIEAPMLPEPVLRQFGEALGKVWILALEEANGELDAEREEMNRMIQSANLRVHEASALRERADRRVGELEGEVRTERDRRQSAENLAASRGAEIEALRASLADWQAQAAASDAARKDVEAQFSRDLEAERMARQRDTERLEGDVAFAKIQIDHARELSRTLKEQLDRARSDAEIEAAKNKQRIDQLEVDVRESREQTRIAETALAGARIDLVEASARLDDLKDRIRNTAKSAGRQSLRSTKAHLNRQKK